VKLYVSLPPPIDAIEICDVLGMIDGPKTDSVEMKKRIQRGEKI